MLNKNADDVVALQDGTHIHYADLMSKIATYIYVETSHETTTNNYTIYVDEIEDDLCLQCGFIDQDIAEDIRQALLKEFENQVAEVELVFEEGDDEHTEVDRYFDVTLYDDFCFGFVFDDQAIIENQQN